MQNSGGSIRLLAPLAAVSRALRYRFFLVAGVFPFLLGATVAHRAVESTDWWTLLLGLLCVIAVSAGIEGLNEYFDSLIGTDRVFELSERVKVRWHLPLGLSGFFVAFLIAVYLTVLKGWPIMAFALAGAAAAFSYLFPKVQLAYRGLGETVIALSYGCGLTLGGYYLQAGSLSWICLWASLLPAFLILALTVANEVPDYYGDLLVGKRNLVVRLGRRGAARLYGIITALTFILLLIGLLEGIYPPLLGWAFLLAPLAFANGWAALRLYEAPESFCRVIRGAILQYVLITLLASASYLWSR